MDADGIRNRLARLEELEPAVAQDLRDAWPSTLAVLDEPDGTIVEIPIGGQPVPERRPGVPPTIQATAKHDIATLRRQLGEHLEEELDRLDPERAA